VRKGDQKEIKAGHRWILKKNLVGTPKKKVVKFMMLAGEEKGETRGRAEKRTGGDSDSRSRQRNASTISRLFSIGCGRECSANWGERNRHERGEKVGRMS